MLWATRLNFGVGFVRDAPGLSRASLENRVGQGLKVDYSGCRQLNTRELLPRFLFVPSVGCCLERPQRQFRAGTSHFLKGMRFDGMKTGQRQDARQDRLRYLLRDEES